jgi:YesN/AraC family two-component response regulator
MKIDSLQQPVPFTEKREIDGEQIHMEAGFGDFGFFRNIFKRLTGVTPQEYKKKYGQMFNEAVVG